MDQQVLMSIMDHKYPEPSFQILAAKYIYIYENVMKIQCRHILRGAQNLLVLKLFYHLRTNVGYVCTQSRTSSQNENRDTHNTQRESGQFWARFLAFCVQIFCKKKTDQYGPWFWTFPSRNNVHPTWIEKDCHKRTIMLSSTTRYCRNLLFFVSRLVLKYHTYTYAHLHITRVCTHVYHNNHTQMLDIQSTLKYLGVILECNPPTHTHSHTHTHINPCIHEKNRIKK